MIPNKSSAPDYRRSHLERGQHYDANLDQDPASAYLTAWERELLPRVVSPYFPSGIDRYLDFACGTGRVTQLLAPFAQQVVGVDVSESMMSIAMARLPEARFLHADITRADDNKAHDLGLFNLIRSFRFFGNAEDSLRVAVLRALHERLADDGILLINNHRNPNAIAMRLQRATGGAVEGGRRGADRARTGARFGCATLQRGHFDPRHLAR